MTDLDELLARMTIDEKCAGRLGFTGEGLRDRVEPGAFTFRVGDLSETVTVTGDVAFPDRNALPPVSSELA